MNRKNKILKVGIGITLFLISYFLFISPTSAQTTVGLDGWAWSSLPSGNSPDTGAGWIHFKGPTYQVVADSSTGNLSGYAWSENYGWLSFNASDVSGCPTSPCQPNVNPSTGAVTGWARFIAAPAGTGAIWNGWVHLAGSNYGVTYNSGSQQFSGFAYGENYIGWMHWAGPNYAVTMAPLVSPTATINVTISPASASWTINPGNFTGTGNGTATVTPPFGGTSYTLTPGAAPSGYIYPPTITSSPVNTGSTIPLVQGGDTWGFNVVYSQAFDYTLSNSGDVSVEKAGIPQSGQNTVTETMTAQSGPGQSTTLSASGLPSGVSVGFSNQGCVPSQATPCSFTTTFTVQPSAVAGTYPITVTGAPLGRTTGFNLIINNSPNMIVSCTANPTSALVGQDVTWTVNVLSDPNNNSPYTFDWSGDDIPLPPNDPQTQSIIVNYSTTGSKQATATVWDSKLNQATCPTGFINIGANPGFGEF